MKKDHDFVRDEASGALINTNVSAFKQYKLNRENMIKVNEVNQQVSDLKSQVDELKKLLLKTLEEKNG